MAIVDELVTVLGVKLAPNTNNQIEGFKNKTTSLVKNLTMLGATVTGAAVAIKLFVLRSVNQAAELDKLSKKTGLSTDSLQEWAYAAKQVGVNSDAVQNDLSRLQKKIGATGKDSQKALLAMANGFEKLTEAQAYAKGKKLGLSDDTIILLRKGREGVEALRKEAHNLGGVIPAEAIKRAAQFKTKVEELKFTWRGITSQVALSTIPTLDKMVDSFKNWTTLNREWIALRLGEIVRGASSGFERFLEIIEKHVPFRKLIEDTKEAAKGIQGFEDIIGRVSLAGITALGLALLPAAFAMGITAAKVTLLIMALDELVSFMQGKGGYLADFAEKTGLARLGGGFMDWMMDEWEEMQGTKPRTVSPNMQALEERVARINAGEEQATIPRMISELRSSIENKFSAIWSSRNEKRATGEYPSLSEAWSMRNVKFPSSLTQSLGGSLADRPQAGKTEYNDHKTVTITINTSDPLAAGEAAASAIKSSTINAPGPFAPASM